MSSLVRRLAIRMMERAGYTREKWVIVKGPKGEPKLQNVKRGGEITDPDDDPIGRKWPARIPARASSPTREQKRAYPGADREGRKARGRRRGKYNPGFRGKQKAVSP